MTKKGKKITFVWVRKATSIIASVILIVCINIFLFVLFTGHNGNNNVSKNQAQSLKTIVQQEVKGEKAPTIPDRTVYVGIWTQGFWDKNTNTLHPQALRSVEETVGKRFAIAHYYRGWDALDSPLFLAELQTIDANGWRPMMSANPYFFNRCESHGLSLYKAISNGNCDDFLHSVGRQLKAFGKTVFLRFAWEMNIPSMEWAVMNTKDTNEDFKKAWQRVHDIIYQEGATNVLFVFSPHIITSQSIAYSELYPGDSFVDWIALDGFNWGTTQTWSTWQSFDQVFSASYTQFTAIAPNKPLMIAEVNSTDKGGNKAFWYRDMLEKQIPYNYKKVQAVVFYNEDRTAQENVNWLINISEQALSSFSNAIKSGIYKSIF